MIVHILGGPRDGDTVMVSDGARVLTLVAPRSLRDLFAVNPEYVSIETTTVPIEHGRCGRHFVVVPEGWR